MSKNKGSVPTYGESGGILRYIEIAVFFASLLYAALLLAPTYYLPILAGLDPSWGFGLNYFAHSEFKFGHDLIFTYGPLGFISVPMNIGSNIAVAMLVRAAVWGVMLWQLLSIRLSGRRSAAWIIMISLIVSNRLFYYYWDYFLTAVILVLCYRLIERQAHEMELGLLAVLLGISFLVKVSVFVLGSMAFFVYVVGEVLSPSCFRVRRLSLLLVLASGPLAYFLYNPSIQDLLLYIKGTSEMTAGYAAWASLPTVAALAFRAEVIIAAIVACLLYAVWRRTLRVAPAALAFVAIFVAFRHGFIRSEVQHSAMFLAFSIPILGVLLASISVTKGSALGYGIVFCAFTAIALQGVSAAWPVWSSFWWSPSKKLAEVNTLFHWDRTQSWLSAVSRDSLKSIVLSQYAKDIQRSHVLVFPWDLSFASRQDFKLVPLYTMQGYVAYTRYLDRKSATNLLSAEPPIDFVLFEWQSIDGRHPLLDVPAIWNALFDDYVPQRVYSDSVLLKRRTRPMQISYAPLASTKFHAGEWASVPRRRTPVGVSIDLKPTFIGSAVTALYKLPLVFCEFRTLSGASTTFRVPADVMATPFSLSSLPMSFNTLMGLWSDNRVDDPVVELRLTGDGLAYMSAADWQFYDVRGSNILVAGAPETLSSKFGIEGIAGIKSLLSGYIDNVAGRQMPKLDAPEDPVILNSHEDLTLGGWVTYGDYATAVTMDEIYAVVSGSLIKAEREPRPDVGAHFNNPMLNASGYRVRLASNLLGSGLQRIELIGYTRADHKLYRLPGALYIFTK